VKFYVTKYALTSGIEEVEANEPSPTSPKFLSIGGFHSAWGEGKQWHRDLESAVKRAEEMRGDKIASLKKAIARLEKIDFGDIHNILKDKK